ncbi:MAG: TerC family protein [Burkholderiales bacterium]
MDIFSFEFLSALGAIILIDLVLAGDNALVIALAARNLPADLQRRAILWGTGGAIAVRSLMTVGVVWLLQVPGLMLTGGLLLVWIAIKLLRPQDEASSGDGHGASAGFWGAMKTIIVADAVMGVDNVLGVAGAAQGSFLLVVIGLLVSIPVVVWCSTLVLKLVERFPAVIYAGSGVLAATAATMVLDEPLLAQWVDPISDWSWLFIAAMVVFVVLAGLLMRRERIAAPREKAHSA